MLSLVFVVVGGVSLYAFGWTVRGAKEVPMSSALDRFRSTASTASVATPAPLLPAAGVYRYSASGTERLSFLNAKQSWGANVPATVTYTKPGCFVSKIEFSNHHFQDFEYCASGGRLLETGGTTSQTFVFAGFSESDVEHFTCTPSGPMVDPDASVGSTATLGCDGSSPARHTKVHTAVTITYLGHASVKVGTATVGTYRVHVVRLMTGDQVGSEVSDAWFSASTGILVKLVRDTTVRSPSPIGKVTYTEHGSLLLASMVPQR